MPVHYRRQIGEPAGQPDIRYIRAPDLVGPNNLELLEQVRVYPVRRIRPGQVPRREQRHYPHLAQQRADMVPADGTPALSPDFRLSVFDFSNVSSLSFGSYYRIAII